MKLVKNSSHTMWLLGEKILHYLSPNDICLLIIRRLSDGDESYTEMLVFKFLPQHLNLA